MFIYIYDGYTTALCDYYSDTEPHLPVMSSSKKMKIGNFISSAKFDFHGSILAVYLKYNQVI